MGRVRVGYGQGRKQPKPTSFFRRKKMKTLPKKIFDSESDVSLARYFSLSTILTLPPLSQVLTLPETKQHQNEISSSTGACCSDHSKIFYCECRVEQFDSYFVLCNLLLWVLGLLACFICFMQRKLFFYISLYAEDTCF